MIASDGSLGLDVESRWMAHLRGMLNISSDGLLSNGGRSLQMANSKDMENHSKWLTPDLWNFCQTGLLQRHGKSHSRANSRFLVSRVSWLTLEIWEVISKGLTLEIKHIQKAIDGLLLALDNVEEF